MDEENEVFLESLQKSEAKDYSLSKDYKEEIEDLNYRFGELKTARSPWIKTWRELSDYIDPLAGKYIGNVQSQKKGEQDKDKILCGFASFALNTLYAGMLGGLTSPIKPWFQLELSDDDQDDEDVKGWFSQVEEEMRSVMHRSNYYEAITKSYRDLGLFGTHAMIIYEDMETVIRCESLAMGTYYLDSDDEGNITTLMREFSMTLYQMVKRFGEDALDENLKRQWKNKQGLGTEYTINQAIFPNKDYYPEAKGLNARAYLDVMWMEGESRKVLWRKGFREKPFVAPRWSVVASDVYGESPAMMALSDIKRLQYYTKKEMQATEKNINPPLLASTALKDQPTHLTPNGVTYTPNITDEGMRALYEVNPAVLTMINNLIEKLEKNINEAFHVPLWMLFQQMEGIQPRNTLEITERRGEKIVKLSPVIQKVNSEQSEPSIERIFSIMFRKGLLPEPPEKLRNMTNFKIKYTSELAVAQNAKDTVPIEQFLDLIGNMFAAMPSVLQKVDEDAVVDVYGKALNLNPKIIRSTEEAMKIRQAQQQQAQQQQMIEQGLQMAQAGKVLSDTNVGGGLNALQMAGIGA